VGGGIDEGTITVYLATSVMDHVECDEAEILSSEEALAVP
jgi:hypothetical protein